MNVIIVLILQDPQEPAKQGTINNALVGLYLQ